MTNKRADLCFIIALRPGAEPTELLESIETSCKKAGIDAEVLLSFGTRPAYQRNLAAKKTTRSHLYFLDDDSRLEEGTLEQAITLISEGQEIVGGPSLLRDSASDFEKLVQEFFTSTLGLGSARSRYSATGSLRRTDGEELILCNLIVDREIFEELGGFNSRLYPNEENEFFKRALKEDVLLAYCPELLVRRGHRKTLGSFAAQLFSYGRGRGTHILSGFRAKDFRFFLPSSFALYLLLIPLFAQTLFVLPALAYFALLFTVALTKLHKVKGAWRLPVLFLVGHISYGAGVIAGLFKSLPGSQELLAITASEVHIEERRVAGAKAKSSTAS